MRGDENHGPPVFPCLAKRLDPGAGQRGIGHPCLELGARINLHQCPARIAGHGAGHALDLCTGQIRAHMRKVVPNTPPPTGKQPDHMGGKPAHGGHAPGIGQGPRAAQEHPQNQVLRKRPPVAVCGVAHGPRCPPDGRQMYASHAPITSWRVGGAAYSCFASSATR